MAKATNVQQAPAAAPAAAPAITQVRTVAFQGELPKRGGGFTRKPNPFDTVMAGLTFDEEGKSGHMLTEVSYTNPDELKPYVTLLRNAAKHIDKGLDVWTVENGIVWMARPVRAKAAAGTATAA